MRKVLMVMSLALPAVVACAQAATLAEWGRDTLKSYDDCSFVGAAARIMNNVGADDIEKARECVDGKLQQGKATFDALPPPRQATAAAALKEYYAAWIAAMRSVPSRLADSSRAAETASTSTKQRLNELWARFETEAGL